MHVWLVVPLLMGDVGTVQFPVNEGIGDGVKAGPAHKIGASGFGDRGSFELNVAGPPSLVGSDFVEGGDGGGGGGDLVVGGGHCCCDECSVGWLDV